MEASDGCRWLMSVLNASDECQWWMPVMDGNCGCQWWMTIVYVSDGHQWWMLGIGVSNRSRWLMSVMNTRDGWQLCIPVMETGDGCRGLMSVVDASNAYQWWMVNVNASCGWKWWMAVVFGDHSKHQMNLLILFYLFTRVLYWLLLTSLLSSSVLYPLSWRSYRLLIKDNSSLLLVFVPLWKESLNSDGRQSINTNKKKYLWSQLITTWSKWTTTHDVGNPDPGLGPAHTCGGVRSVDGITTLYSW
jgi:hypothetical protein